MSTTELSVSESEELAQHEAVIARGFETFVEVGAALLTIREKRLYRCKSPTFEDYCREQWGMRKSHTYRLIDAATVVNNIVYNLSPIGDKPSTTLYTNPAIPPPESEGQVRPLARLEPDQQREAWNLAVNSAPNGRPTARQVEVAARAVSPVSWPPFAPTVEADDVGETETPDEPDEPEHDPDAPIRLKPKDEVEADRWAAIWIKKFDDWLIFTTSLDRRGGIVTLSKYWPRGRRNQLLEILKDLAAMAQKCVSELEELG
jgi:hypothetical protein